MDSNKGIDSLDRPQHSIGSRVGVRRWIDSLEAVDEASELGESLSRALNIPLLKIQAVQERVSKSLAFWSSLKGYYLGSYVNV